MATLNSKPVRLLMQDMITSMGLGPEDTFTREQAVKWFSVNYPNVKQGTVAAHLIRLSTNAPSRIQYSARSDGSVDKFFKIDGRTFRLYRANEDPAPIREGQTPTDQLADSNDLESTSEFAYERDLRDYLARNLHLIDPTLRLYEDEGIKGIEFPVGGRFVDILATDGVGYIVIELKVSKGYDRAVGQLLRYIGWIKRNHAESNQPVRGVIVAKKISDDLLIACAEVPGVSLYEYELSVLLTPVKLANSNSEMEI